MGDEQRAELLGVQGDGQVGPAVGPPALDRLQGLPGQRPGVAEVEVGEPLALVVAEQLEVTASCVTDEPVRQAHRGGGIGPPVDEVAELDDDQVRGHAARGRVAPQAGQGLLQLRRMAPDVTDERGAPDRPVRPPPLGTGPTRLGVAVRPEGPVVGAHRCHHRATDWCGSRRCPAPGRDVGCRSVLVPEDRPRARPARYGATRAHPGRILRRRVGQRRGAGGPTGASRPGAPAAVGPRAGTVGGRRVLRGLRPGGAGAGTRRRPCPGRGGAPG